MNDPSLIGEGHRVADCPSSEYFGQEGGSGDSQNKGPVRAAPHPTAVRSRQGHPGAKLFEVDGNHFACADRRCDFVPKLVEACDYVDFAASANPAVSALAQGSRGQ